MSQLTAPEFLGSPVLSGLRTQFETAGREEAALEPRYLPRALELRTARARTNNVVAMFRAEVRNIAGSAEAELRGVTRAEGNVRSELALAQRQAVELNQQEMLYSRLSRERENHAKLYGIVLERATEGNLMRDLQVNNISVLDYALQPGAPIKPRVAMNLGVGAAGGLVLGVLAALLAIQPTARCARVRTSKRFCARPASGTSRRSPAAGCATSTSTSTATRRKTAAPSKTST
jgi:uncharacterized protein involved in exopolysaccharide biosynthesis